MFDGKEAFQFLETEIKRMGRQRIFDFGEYLEMIRQEPQKILRNIFQLFYDMVKNYVGEGADEYPEDPESIGFVKYDCSRIFVNGADNPFFADRLFANRFIRQVESLRQGFQQNRIYIYEGPSGCGKSTFLNNLLRVFEAYTKTDEGQIFEIFWEIDEKLFQTERGECAHPCPQKIEISCPSHDYPILIIPKDYREGCLDRLWPKGKPEILKSKDYEWLYSGEACTICNSIFESLLERLGSLDKVLNMARCRLYKFNRRIGEGISIFNPGDRPDWGMFNGRPIGGLFVNKEIQQKLDKIFGVNAIKYAYSSLAKTNNGIYVLMDVKLHNEERLRELHNVISEGVHKVGDIEERINSLFLALMNPEDKKIFDEMESFKGRVSSNKIPFVLEPATEVNIYRGIFGSIDQYFLPRVLENFAKVIIASRMNTDSKALQEWIPDLKEYERYCDANGLLLRMHIFSGIIPAWLSDEDKMEFTAPIRRALIAEGEEEGDHGFSGRDSIDLLGKFLGRYSGRSNLINMENVADFFKHRIGRDRRDDYIPKNFLSSLLDSYNYTVLNEVKESLYFYNEEQIQKDILNYLCAVNYDIGDKTKCKYTDQEIEITIDFLKLMAGRISGKEMGGNEPLKFAQDIQKKYITCVTREQVDITKTELYHDLFTNYIKNLKYKVLQPFIKNENFREAIKAFGTEAFKTFDTRLKEHVDYMINNLIKKFSYTEQGAKEICLYVIDKKLVEKFS
jgi:predicted Ser/Thr protein kinase